MTEPGSHYFDESPTVPSAPHEVELTLPDMTVRLLTDRGVFGYRQIDSASRLLLRRAPPPPDGGHLLDLGCGTGALALVMARRAPASTVWAIDSNGRARELCASNAEHNDIANIRVAAPSDVPEEIRFDAIWSNPPIRIGKPALHDLLGRWLRRLLPGGLAVLVVSKHLGADSLQAWLTDQGLPTTRAASVAGTRLLHVRSAGSDAQ